MKTSVFSVLIAIIPNFATGLCFVPLLLLSWKKMRQVGTYRVLALYWFVNGLINLSNLGHLGLHSMHDKLSLLYNLINTPLILFAFATAASGRRRKQLLLVMLGFIILELGLVSWMGYNSVSNNLIICLGLLLVLTCCVSGLVQYMQRMEHTPFENAMAFVHAALLFAYCSFLIIFIFFNLAENSFKSNRDSFILYYIGLLLSAGITSLGLWSYGIRTSALKGAGSTV